jgi:uncharacterized protein YwqG
MSMAGRVVVGLLIVSAAVFGACQRRKAAAPPVVPVPTRAHPAPTQPQPEHEVVQRDWRTLVEMNRLSRYAPPLAKLAKPAVQLVTRRTPTADIAVGQSRIGGVPDLPVRFAWPTYHGKHLAFIAQINLGDVARLMPDGPLPKKGQLWFFYAWSQEQWGFDPKDAGSSVVHYEADAQLARRALPDDIPDEGRYPSCGVTFRAYEDIPDASDPRNPTSKSDDATQDRYGQVRNEVASVKGTSHKLLGYAEPIQNPMELECALVTNGVYTVDAKAHEHPRYKELDRTKYDWHLLMQVDSDDAADMMWGDVGRLYFWIRDQDLRARRFDKTWMIFQCG